MNIFKDGDRVIVKKSLHGIYDGKKGIVTRILDDETIEVILDVNRGSICEKTLFPMSSVEIDSPIPTVTAKQAGDALKKVTDAISLDDRMDSLEVILSKYGLSIKDGCGFMYIYDFLDELANKWGEIEESDKDDISFCLVGDKNNKKV